MRVLRSLCEAAGLTLPGLDRFCCLGFSAPSPRVLLVPEPPQGRPSPRSHLAMKHLYHLIVPVPMDPTAEMPSVSPASLAPTPQKLGGHLVFFTLDPFRADPVLC